MSRDNFTFYYFNTANNWMSVYRYSTNDSNNNEDTLYLHSTSFKVTLQLLYFLKLGHIKLHLNFNIRYLLRRELREFWPFYINYGHIKWINQILLYLLLLSMVGGKPLSAGFRVGCSREDYAKTKVLKMALILNKPKSIVLMKHH